MKVFSEQHRENIGKALRGKKRCSLSASHREKISVAHSQLRIRDAKSKVHLGKKVSEVTRKKISTANMGKKRTQADCKKNRESHSTFEAKKHMSESHIGKKHSKETKEKIRERAKGRKKSVKTRLKMSVAATIRNACLIRENQHNWNRIAPFGLENEPLERAFDLFFLLIFEADIHHTFKTLVPWDNHSKQYQLDFVSWLLKCNLEADELDHDKTDHEAWDKQRDRAFYDTKELLSFLRYKQLEAETNFADIVRRVYYLCNELREQYNLLHLPILVYDERWNFYCGKMQEFLKEFRISRDYKKFDESKRELDKQYLCFFEETYKNLQTNFVELVRESFETKKNIDQTRIESPWRKAIQ